MNPGTDTPLSVSIRDLPPAHVAFATCRADDKPDEFGGAIRKCFQRVQAWVREQGYDPYALLTVGVIETADGRLSSYDCCVQVPETVTDGSGIVGIKELVGGRYAVVHMDKDPAVIGSSIQRFHQEYVPRNGIQIDGTRPTYEIYAEHTMDYCVPIAAGLHLPCG